MIRIEVYRKDRQRFVIADFARTHEEAERKKELYEKSYERVRIK